jgi:hypothetical protein
MKYMTVRVACREDNVEDCKKALIESGASLLASGAAKSVKVVMDDMDALDIFLAELRDRFKDRRLVVYPRPIRPRGKNIILELHEKDARFIASAQAKTVKECLSLLEAEVKEFDG